MKLSDYLEKERISQSEFAELIGSTPTTISRLAHGTQNPSWTTMLKITQATKGKVKPNDFFEKE
jgi:transcriptional regulator with XRE-family HTH domain